MALRIPLRWGCFQNSDAIGQIERRAKAIGQAGFNALAHNDPIDNHIDIMAKFLIQGWRLVQITELSIHFDPLKTLFAQL